MTGLTKMELRRDLVSGQETIYYVLVKDRVTVGVETTSWMAEQRARELSTAGSPCTIIAAVPKEKEKAPEVSSGGDWCKCGNCWFCSGGWI